MYKFHADQDFFLGRTVHSHNLTILSQFENVKIFQRNSKKILTESSDEIVLVSFKVKRK